MSNIEQNSNHSNVLNQFKSHILELQNAVKQLSETPEQTPEIKNNTSERLEKLNNQINELNIDFIELSAKFDVWQSNVEPMLANAHTAMQYDNFVLTALAIIIAIFAFIFQKWSMKTKREAISDAIKNIESTIADGILPPHSGIRKKLTEAILNSEEFRTAARKANNYIADSDDADEERTPEVESETKNINLEDIKKAKATAEISETSTPNKKAVTMKNKKLKRKRKEAKNEHNMP